MYHKACNFTEFVLKLEEKYLLRVVLKENFV